MEIVRQIGELELLIETSDPQSIFLPEDVIDQETGSSDSPMLTRRQILKLLSNGDTYRPLSLTWEMLDKCNFSCPFCYIAGHSRNRIIRFTEIKSHLSDLVEEGLLFCTLSGGEATMHPDFSKIYTFLKENGVIVRVFTNGFHITDALYNLWKIYPPSEVQVSIYTLDNEKLRKLFGVKHEYGASKVMQNVLKLKEAKVNVTCKTFINSLTQVDAISIIEWCRENEIEHFSSSELTDAYDGSNLTGFAIPETTAPSLPESPICFPCGTKNYGCALSSAFEIFPCLAIQLKDCRFDLRTLGVKESITQMKAFVRKFQNSKIRGSCKTGKCATCIAFAKPVRDKYGTIIHFAHP